MNKLLARVVAVVMAIAMLGTVSFAASYDAGTVKPAVDGRADTAETVLVFATNTPNDEVFDGNDKIVAIAQAADVPVSIPVDADAVAEYDYLTIAYGGNGADTTTQYAFLNIKGEVTVDELVVAREIELDGKVYNNVAYAKFSAVADGTLTKYGIKFSSYDAEGNQLEGAMVKDFAVETAIEVSGRIEFGALVLGVPYEDTVDAEGNPVAAIRGNIKAFGYVEYAQ